MKIDTVLEFLDMLKKRQQMYVWGDSYKDLVNFTSGFFIGINLAIGSEIVSRFDKWLHAKLGIEPTNYGPANYILEKVAKNDEEKAKDILISYLIEFFDHEKNWLGEHFRSP